MGHEPCTQPTCSICHRKECFDFSIPDWIWAKVVPQSQQNSVICLCCFDELAKQHGVEYADHLRKLYFAGRQAHFEFAVVNAF